MEGIILMGDKEFEEYMNKESSYMDEEKRTDESFFVIVSMREKMKAINESIKVASDSLAKLQTPTIGGIPETDLKKKLEEHIIEMLELFQGTLHQFDCLIAHSIGIEDDDEENDDDDDLGDIGED